MTRKPLSYSQLQVMGTARRKTILGDDFRAWMNRPSARVQVYAWAVARLFPEYQHRASIRMLNPFRDAEIREWRKTTAAAIRLARTGGKIRLPLYDEQTGNYIFAKEAA